MVSRRHALRAAALLSAGILAPLGAARAFRIQEESDSPRVRAMIAACETRDAHARLIAELVADLEGAGGRETAVETVRAMACPLCGCRLADGIPRDDSAPAF